VNHLCGARPRLARNRAERIRETGEDLLPSIPYFNKLMLAADYPEGLIELGQLDDDDIFYTQLSS
jgi:hypothetical protein